MYTTAWELFKRFAPLIAIALVVLAVYMAGCHHVQKEFDKYVAQVEAQSALVKQQAEAHNKDVQLQLNESARIIGDIYVKNTQENKPIVTHNRELLDNSLRVEPGSHSSQMSNNSTSSSVGNDTSAGSELFLKNFGKSLIDNAARADQVTESLRACQQYVISIQEVINGNANRDIR